MDIASFKRSLSEAQPPVELDPLGTALWYDAKGDWDKSHSLVDGLEGKTAAWIHAYLHRKEGDLWNADYWYRKAGQIRPDLSLDEEWTKLVTAVVR